MLNESAELPGFKPKPTNTKPNIDMVESALTHMINNAAGEELQARIKFALAAFREYKNNKGGDAQAAFLDPPANTARRNLRKTLNTKFNEHVTRAASHDDPERRASALAKAHAIYDDAEAARRARIASQRREQSARIKKKLASRKKFRAVQQACTCGCVFACRT